MKQSDVLAKLFGSATRVKVLKFFLLNQEEAFSVDSIAARLRTKPQLVKSEMKDLLEIGFIKQKTITETVQGARKLLKKKVAGYRANSNFVLSSQLRDLIIEAGGMHIADLGARFSKGGKIGLLVVSGIFLHDTERSLDIMIVGDRLERKTIELEMKKLESEIGKELRYALFDTEEFMYRLKMYDKLLRDVLDYPHEKVIQKIDHPELK